MSAPNPQAGAFLLHLRGDPDVDSGDTTDVDSGCQPPLPSKRMVDRPSDYGN